MSATPNPDRCPSHGRHSTLIAVLSATVVTVGSAILFLMWDMRGTVCEMHGTLSRIVVEVDQIKTATVPPAPPHATGTDTRAPVAACAPTAFQTTAP